MQKIAIRELGALELSLVRVDYEAMSRGGLSEALDKRGWRKLTEFRRP